MTLIKELLIVSSIHATAIGFTIWKHRTHMQTRAILENTLLFCYPILCWRVKHLQKKTQLEQDLTEHYNEDVNEHVNVQVKYTPRLGRGQRGLFSIQNIKRNEMVVSMNRRNTVKYSNKTWQEICAANNRIPRDAAIKARGRMITDWVNERIPVWYFLNHSRHSPNVKMKYTNYCIAWFATEDIRKNTELTFNYGDTPDEWN